MSVVFDPLTAREPIQAQAHAESYWAASVEIAPSDDGPLQDDRDTDVAIIGGGYTGLSCAYYLAKNFGVKALVLEANLPGWGASGRNGGHARPVIGRVPTKDWISKWGVEKAQALFAEQYRAFDTLKELIQDGSIDCDAQYDGWLRIAHSKSRVRILEEECRLFNDVYGLNTAVIDESEIRAKHFIGAEAFSALHFPDAVNVHPMKLAHGVLRMARDAGAVVHRNTPVLACQKDNSRHILKTPHGLVNARNIVIAAGGYSGEFIHPFLQKRILPVISNAAVTRPMTEVEKSEANFISSHQMSDTRNILYYFRRLPDDRVLIGGRGPFNEQPKTLEYWSGNLLDTLHAKFPALRNMVFDYSWHGWICTSFDSMPHVYHVEDDVSVSYSLGYNGSGISCGLYAGRRLAEDLAGAAAPQTMLGHPLPTFPCAAFRSVARRMAYAWYGIKDRWI